MKKLFLLLVTFLSLGITGCSFLSNNNKENSFNSNSKIKHHFSDEWEHDPNYHWHRCLDKGYEDLKGDKEEHRFSKVVTEPTETTGGYTTYTCDICGYWVRAEQTDPVHNTETEPDATLDKIAFTLDDSETYYKASAKEQTIIGDLIIPSYYNHLPVKEVVEHGFEMSNISYAYIPSSIKTLGEAAFGGCMNLREVKFASTVPPEIGSDLFSGTWDSDEFTILVPNEGVEAYKAVDSPFWQEYAVRHIYGY